MRKEEGPSSSPPKPDAVGMNSPSGHPNFRAVGPDEAAFGVTLFNSIPADLPSPLAN